MDFIKILGVGIITAVISVLIRQYKPEYALILALAAGCIMITAIAFGAYPAIYKVKELLNSASLGSINIDILLKALGIAFITQLAVDACKDAGVSSIATKIELAGKIAILITALPLFEKLADIALSLIKR